MHQEWYSKGSRETKQKEETDKRETKGSLVEQEPQHTGGVVHITAVSAGIAPPRTGWNRHSKDETKEPPM